MPDFEASQRFSGARRRQHQKVLRGVVRLLVGIVLLVIGLGAAYQVGVSQSQTETTRLLHDLDLQHEINRQLKQELATLEHQLAPGESRQHVPSPEGARTYAPDLASIIEIAQGKLAQGVSGERLGRAMAILGRDRSCQTDGELKRATVGTFMSREAGSVSFPAGRITASFRGVAARDPSGKPEAWFDPAQPVEMQISATGQPSRSVSSLLPIEQRLVIDHREHILAVKAAGRRGQVEIQLRICEYP